MIDCPLPTTASRGSSSLTCDPVFLFEGHPDTVTDLQYFSLCTSHVKSSHQEEQTLNNVNVLTLSQCPVSRTHSFNGGTALGVTGRLIMLLKDPSGAGDQPLTS